VLVGIEDVIERMMGAGKLDIEEIISMTRTEYSFWMMDLEYDECGQPKASSNGWHLAHKAGS